MSAMGVIIDQFNVPVCNKFKATILNDQLCYEVDPNDFKDSLHLDRVRCHVLKLLASWPELQAVTV